MKKTIFMLLFVALGLQQALAQNFTFDGLNYTVTSETTASVAGNPGISGAITIPAEVTNNGASLSVTSIGEDAFRDCSGLTSVTIPNSVTSIGRHAFRECSGLTSVTIPTLVTSIDFATFHGCSGLTSVTIPNLVTRIGSHAFLGCSGLTSVTIGNSVTSIDYSAFAHCSGLTSVTIPNSVNSIGELAFYGCSGLTSLTIPNSVTSIGIAAFQYCSGLTSVTIGNSVNSIGSQAFAYCSGLKSVACEMVTPLSINSNVFQGVNQGACSLTVPAGSIAAYKAADVWKHFCATITENTTTVTACNSYFWTNNSQTYTASGIYTGTTTNCVTEKLNLTITTVTPTDNTTTLTACNSYFWANNSQSYTTSGTYTGTTTNCVTEKLVLTITTPTSQTNFSSGGLNYIVTSATTVAVGINSGASGTIIIPASVSNGCFNYTVTRIGHYAFENCSGLTSVTIPESVTSIGIYAFYNCSNLTSVTLPNSLTSIGLAAFYNCSGLASVTIPNSVTSIGQHAFYNCSSLTSVTIPNLLTSIGKATFALCSGLTSVNIPNLVTSIGQYAFYNCFGLTSVSIPNSVVSIGNQAFLSCKSLTSVSIPNSVIIIDYGAFAFCSGLTSVNIPNSVTSIGASAFQDCSGLTSVTIPNSVTSIGENAFYKCSNLKSVVCEIETPLSINSNVFQYVNQGACSLTVPNASVAAYSSALVWKDFAPITCATPTENTTTVTACNSYTWTNNSQSYTASGTYTGTTTNCVTEKLNLTIDITPAPTASAQTFCGGKTVADLAANGTDIKWYVAETGGATLTDETALVTGTTYYASQTVNGCESARTGILVTLRALPTPSISGNPIICTGGTKTLDAGTGYASYLWTPNGETTQTITVGDEATFSVTVTDNFGCSGTSTTINTAFSTTSVGLSNLGTSCLGGAQLALSGDVSSLSSVQWYNNATPIGSAIPIPLPTVVAGNNGTGNASNQFDQPMGITVDPDGNVYVADFNNHRIQKWAPGATSGITVAGGNGAGNAANQLFGPVRIVFDAAGNLYVADMHNHRIQKWAPGATSGITVAGGNGAGNAANQLINPCGVTVDATGNVYVSELGNNRIQKWEPNATVGITVAGGHGQGSDANQLSYPYDITVDGAGNVYVADLLNSRIQKWTPGATQGITVAGGNGAGSALNQLASPSALHIDASETLYIADLSSNRVMKWAKGAKEGVVVAGGFQPVITNQWGPTGVFVTNAGEIYITTYFGYSIQKWESYHQAFTPTTAGSYTAVVTNVHGCTTTTNAVVVPIPTAAPGAIAGANTICKSTTVTYSIDPVANATSYQWTLPTGATGTSTSTSISVTFGSTFNGGNLCVQAVNDACLSAASCLTITPLTSIPPAPVVITGPVTIAPNTTKTYNIASVANATSYIWTAPANATLVSGQGTTSATFDFGLGYTTGIITVKASNCKGNSATRSLSVKKVGLSALKATQCDKTLATIKTTISANRIPGATKYRFEVSNNGSVIQTYETTNYYFNLTQLADKPNYNSAYSIRVAVLFDNVWQDYGAPCTVTTPTLPLKTQLKTTQCGTTLALLTSTLSAEVVVNANKYQFEISKNNTVVQELFSNTYFTSLSTSTTKVQYGTSYTIRVKYSLDNGVTWSEYGPSCTLTTPTLPLTKLKTTQCGSTLASLNSPISADMVINANKYQFKISKDNAVIQELTSSLYYTRLTNLTAGAQNGTTYSIRVRYSFDNGATWSAYGMPCNVTSPSAQGLVLNNQNSPEVSVYPNPFSSTFNVATSFEGEVNVKVIDNIGKLIEQFDIDAGELVTKELGQEYVPGMYHVTVTQEMNSKNFKVVKSN